MWIEYFSSLFVWAEKYSNLWPGWWLIGSGFKAQAQVFTLCQRRGQRGHYLTTLTSSTGGINWAELLLAASLIQNESFHPWEWSIILVSEAMMALMALVSPPGDWHQGNAPIMPHCAPGTPRHWEYQEKKNVQLAPWMNLSSMTDPDCGKMCPNFWFREK